MRRGSAANRSIPFVDTATRAFCTARRTMVVCAASFAAALLCFGFAAPTQAFAYENSYSVTVDECYGTTQFDTAVKQSQEAFSQSDWAIIVGEKGWPDALSAAGLAGALDCPILYTQVDALPSVTLEELDRLGVHNVLLLGGTAVVGDAVEAGLRNSCDVERLGGYDQYETQLKIFEYGANRSLWAKDSLFVATGTSFADALSLAPVAYLKKAPLFLVDESLDFTEWQREALYAAACDGYFAGECVVAGGSRVVSENAEGFVSFLSVVAGGAGEECVRLAGNSLYDTNACIASWAVGSCGMRWDKMAFASGDLPYDALAGAALQGLRCAPILLVGEAPSPSIDLGASHAGDVSSCTVFGGPGIIADSMRSYIRYSLGFGYGLPMGATQLADESYIYCNWSGVYQTDRELYRYWLDLASGYSSWTHWLIIVDTSLNKTVVFSNYGGPWVVKKFWTCTTGAWNTPTVKGTFTVGSRGKSFGSSYTCWWWTQFYGNYLFHSVPYNPGSMSSIQDGRLGINASHGCVRLTLENARWIYDTIPSGTKVVVY